MTRNDTYDSLVERARSGGALDAFDYMGYRFTVAEGVFSPSQFHSTRIFTSNVPFRPGCSLLEIGCGAGVTAVMAAVSGCRPVVATDINAAAVENARANVRAHGLQDVVSVRQGDLFDVVREGERFDTIYWNSNFVYVSGDYEYPDDLHRAFFDSGYASHARYLKEAPRYLAAGGTLLLGFGSMGDERSLRQLCAENGYAIITLASVLSGGEGDARFDLLELSPAAPRSAHA